MLFFVANDGTVIKSNPSPVYQGSQDASSITVVAPFAANADCKAVFKLPNGVLKVPLLLTKAGVVEGVINQATENSYAIWKGDIADPISRYYGEVQAQFYFYLADRIVTTSLTTFIVGRGVPTILPPPPSDAPSDDIYEQILSNIASLRSQLDNGFFTARSIYQWNSTYTYGAGEIVFYPNIGEFGAFVKSIKENNLNNAPYASGAINSEWWAEVVNFNTISENYFTTITNAITKGIEDLDTAGNNFKTDFNELLAQAQESAQQAQESAASANTNATFVRDQADAAQLARISATASKNAAAQSATQAEGSASTASTAATNATTAAAEALSSANSAKEFAEIAKEYSQFGIKISTEYTSVEQLPTPGNSQYIYFIPNGSAGDNSYDEYVWIDSNSNYEKIGSTVVDLSDYATKTGTYPDMSVGKATTASTADYATRAVNDAAGNPIVGTYLSKADAASTYAKQNGTYSGMSVGKATNADNADYATKAGSTTNATNATNATNDASGNSISGTYAKQTGTYPDMTAGNANSTNYVVCDTSATVADKAITIPNFTLKDGVRITVQFNNANTANSPTLNVNGTGAVNIFADSDYQDVKWLKNTIMEFVYQGGDWICVSGYPLQGKRVGAYYISNVSTSPANLYGGSWTPITGRFLYCNAGTNTGGSPDAVVVAHSHTGLTLDGLKIKAQGVPNGDYSTALVVATESGNSLVTGTFGESGTGKNMPPYQEVYAWRRTA